MSDDTEDKFGHLEKVQIKDVFLTELKWQQWVKNHPVRLSQALGIEVSNLTEATSIGSFVADLTGVVNETDKVVIELQFGRTDHDHLGKLITYAFGIRAKYLIWIAPELREEHKGALEGLNEEFRGMKVFGVEISSKKMIDPDSRESKPSIQFDVKVSPNEMERIILGAPGKNKIEVEQTAFLQRTFDEFNKKNGPFKYQYVSTKGTFANLGLSQHLHLAWGIYKDKASKKRVLNIGLHLELDEVRPERIAELESIKSKLDKAVREETIIDDNRGKGRQNNYQICIKDIDAGTLNDNLMDIAVEKMQKFYDFIESRFDWTTFKRLNGRIA